MNRTTIAGLLAVVVAVPAGAAGFYLSKSPPPLPCFAAASGAYRMTDSAVADVTVRIDNSAASPSLRLQVVDDPAIADFVVVDDNDGADACVATGATRTVRIDPAAQVPDMTVALSRAQSDFKLADTGNADIKIYVNSATFSEQDAAALYAAIWKNSRRAAPGARVAARRKAE
jgi:hypothetical protein